MPSERVQRAINQLLDEAVTVSAKGDWGTVSSLAERVLTLDPTNADALDFKTAAQRGLAGTKSTAVGADAPTIRTSTGAPPHPASFASGRYAVKKFLGEGGKKKVYLAHDTTLDRDVAFALIKSESLDESARRRILREAQAMGRLGDHPNIVPIHDLGTEGSQPFMVLPLMQGGDVADLIEKSKEHRPPLDQVLIVAKDVCEGLAFAHFKGIVHRDLKPGNVWLTERGQAKIGDFGLALPLDQSRLTREGFMVGTVAYMPPEQAMGGDVTPRADLYSFGCMLYEMVTGRPPFLGDDDIAIIGQHINTPPVAPSWHNPQCPKPLEALILRLLAKDPAQRPESARDVLAALEAVNITGAITLPQAAKDGKEAVGRSLDSMSSGVFVGRHREMDQLRAALEETLSGHGRMVTLVGEPGIGKTRTAQELATYAGLRRCQVLWGKCYEGGGAPPYWPWVQAIRQYVREKDPEQIRREMGSTASVIAEVVADVRDRLPGLASPPQLESPESARFRLFDSIASFLRTASSAQPVVLVLDDLHWSDKPSLLLLEFVARELANSRILLVGTYRDVELNRRHPLAVTLGDLTKDRVFERVLLRGLQKQDVGSFIELAAGVRPPGSLVDAVFSQTEGNPLFVTEVVRLLVQEGLLTRERLRTESAAATGARKERAGAKSTTWTVRIPEGVREVIGRRLDRLSERCNETLTVASVIGREFTLDQLRVTADGMTEDMLLAVLEEALVARVIEELPHAVGLYQFTHALIQETLSNELSITRRVRLHARIAESLEKLYGEKTGEHAAELAEHFASAEAVLGTEKLVRYSLLAGQQALAAYAHDAAVTHFNRGLGAFAGREPRDPYGELTLGLCVAQLATLERHQLQTAVETLTRAVDYYTQTGQRDKAIAAAGTHITPIGDITRVAPLLERVLEMAPPNSREAAPLLASYASHLLLETGRSDEANKAAAKALELARRHGDERSELLALLRLGPEGAGDAPSVSDVVRPHHAQDARTRALELAAKLGDHFAMASIHFASIGDAYRKADIEAAKSSHARMKEAAEKSKDRLQLEVVAYIEAIFLLLTGDWHAARLASDKLTTLSPGSPLPVAVRIQASAYVGDTDDARRQAEALLDLMKEVPQGANHWYNLPALCLPACSYYTGVEFDLASAERAARIASASPSPRAIRGWKALATLAVARNDPALAGEVYPKAALGGGFYFVGGSDTRWLALCAGLTGRIDLAKKHFKDAYEYAKKFHWLPELAWILFDWSETLTIHAEGKSEPGTPSVEEMQSQSIQIARQLGLKPLIQRIIAGKKILKA